MPCARPPQIPPRSRHENPADLAGSPDGGRCLADRSQFYPDINRVGCVGLHALGLDRLVKLVSRNCHRRDTPIRKLPIDRIGLAPAAVVGLAGLDPARL